MFKICTQDQAFLPRELKERFQKVKDMGFDGYEIDGALLLNNLDEVKEALKTEADRIMLDNMSTAMMKEAVEIIGDLKETEASGGITREKLQEIAQTGVDYISVGALTHSAENIDLSLKALKK